MSGRGGEEPLLDVIEVYASREDAEWDLLLEEHASHEPVDAELDAVRPTLTSRA